MASLSLSVLLLLCGIVTIFQAYQVDKLDLPGSDAEWETWKKFHGKTYENPYVETYRKAIWQANLEVCFDSTSCWFFINLPIYVPVEIALLA